VIGNEEIDLQLKLFNNSYENKLFSGNSFFVKIKFDSLEEVAAYFDEKDKADQTEPKDSRYAITVSDNDGTVVWCNSGFEVMSGRSFDEIIGKRPRDAIYGKRSVYIDKNFVDVNVARGEPFYFENIGYTKDGREFWFGVVVHPVFNSRNEIIGRVHLLKDISVSKLRELHQEENENLLTLALEASRVGVWSYDILAEEISVSDIYKSIIGYGKDGKIGIAEFTEIMHPEDLALFRDIIQNRLQKGRPGFAFEGRYLVHGKYRYFNMRGNCIQWGSDGRPTKLVGTQRDITEDKAQAQGLEKQKMFYHNIIDKLPADIVICSPEQKYQYINKHAISDDYTRHWMIGRDDFDYCQIKGIADDLAENRRKVFRQAVTTGEQVSYLEKKVPAEVGAPQYFMHIFSPLFGEDGNPELVIGYGVDVTEQVQNEQYALLQEKRIKNFLDIALDGIFSCDKDGRINSFNRSFVKIMGIEEAQCLDANFYSLLAPAEGTVMAYKASILMHSGASQSGILTIDSQYGAGKKYLDYSLIPDAKEGQDGFLGRISDITDVVLKERHMQQIIENEVQLNKNKSQFIHITSHELRTPLAIIQSNSELLELLFANPVVMARKNPVQLTQRIIQEVETMTDILNQLMLVSRIETGGVEINKEPVDVPEYLLAIAASFRPFTDGRSLEVKVGPEVGSWNLDAKILRHALMNLIGNAFKYSYGRENPVMSVYIRDGKLTISISDKGIGIPDGEINALFRMFYRASNVGVISGTGIGLMVVSYVVQKHNGLITVSSKLNEGTVFTLSIP